MLSTCSCLAPFVQGPSQGSMYTLLQTLTTLQLKGIMFAGVGNCLQVYGLPTLIVFKDGEIVPGSHREGAVGKAQLAEYLKTYAPSTVPAQ